MKLRLFRGTSPQNQSSQLLFRLARRLATSEFMAQQPRRKDIYAYIGQLVEKLVEAADKQPAVKKIMADCEPSWTALRKAREEQQLLVASDWGHAQIPQNATKIERALDIIRKHEP